MLNLCCIYPEDEAPKAIHLTNCVLDDNNGIIQEIMHSFETSGMRISTGQGDGGSSHNPSSSANEQPYFRADSKPAESIKSANWSYKNALDDRKRQDIDGLSVSTVRVKQTSMRYSRGSVEELKALPLLVETVASEREDLFLKKVNMCCFLFDFEDSQLQLKSKEIKRLTLMELAEFISMHQNFLTEPIYASLVKLLQANAFRVVVPTSKSVLESYGTEADEEDIFYEPTWPHLQLVYEVFLRFISSSDFQPSLAKKYLDHRLLTNFVNLFSSEDSRERVYVKTILHRIYGKMVSSRVFIRHLIDNIFLRFVYEEDGHCGIAELLDILESIINGFQVPLKDEHKVFLRRVLLPLHKSPALATFHPHLVRCLLEFIKKDQKLVGPVIKDGILRYWPKTNSHKEVLFLEELETCLEITDSSEFQAISRPVFLQVARCIASDHFQIAERALFMWNNEYIVSMASECSADIIPLIYGALIKAKKHWNKIVHGLVYHVMGWASEMDQRSVDNVIDKIASNNKKEMELRRKRSEQWSRVEKAALIAKNRPATMSRLQTVQESRASKLHSSSATDSPISPEKWKPSVRQKSKSVVEMGQLSKLISEPSPRTLPMQKSVDANVTGAHKGGMNVPTRSISSVLDPSVPAAGTSQMGSITSNPATRLPDQQSVQASTSSSRKNSKLSITSSSEPGRFSPSLRNPQTSTNTRKLTGPSSTGGKQSQMRRGSMQATSMPFGQGLKDTSDKRRSSVHTDQNRDT